jgi:hypothetical protein
MAKAKRTDRRDFSLITRRSLSISNPSRSSSPRPVHRPHPYPRSPEPIQDDRVYHPNPKRPARTLSGSPARVVSPPLPKARIAPSGAPLEVFNSIPQALVFKSPKSVTLCDRRRIRREVIMATGNGGPQRKGKRTELSKVSC